MKLNLKQLSFLGLVVGSVLLVSACSSQGQSVKKTDTGYCNPLYHQCEAPFTIGYDHINQ